MFNVHSRFSRIHKRLSNGQHLTLHIERQKHRNIFSKSPEYNYTAYTIGLVITDKRRACNDWYKGKHKLKCKQTGNCGLEGLRFAFNEIKKLQQSLKIGELIIIGYDDAKRGRAYRYLERIGFCFGEWFGDGVYFYQKEGVA